VVLEQVLRYTHSEIETYVEGFYWGIFFVLKPVGGGQGERGRNDPNIICTYE
jgi:hypothetical protein